MPSQLPSELAKLPEGAWIETYPRWGGQATLGTNATGTIRATAVWLLKDWLVSKVRFFSGAGSVTAFTHSWAGVWRHDTRALVATTADITASWAANTMREFVFPTPFYAPFTGLYWLGLSKSSTNGPTSIVMPQTSVGSTKPMLEDQAPKLTGETTLGFATPGLAPNPIVLDWASGAPMLYAVVL